MRRECPLDLVWPFLRSDVSFVQARRVNVMFQNIASFNKHNKALRGDLGFKRADIIFFSETRTHPECPYERKRLDSLMGDEFGLFYMSGGGANTHKTAHGQMCFVRKSKQAQLKLVAHNCGNNRFAYAQDDDLELSLFRYKMNLSDHERDKLYLLHVYKHPGLSTNRFIQLLVKFLHEHLGSKLVDGTLQCKKKLILVGDFNLDLHRFTDDSYAQRAGLENLLRVLNMRFAFDRSKHPYSTTNETLIDWCLHSREPLMSKTQIDSHVYASHIGYHMPIWCSYSD
jgi:endonuclease/exonuclease/phosphatase family metal-dependent hydrolase